MLRPEAVATFPANATQSLTSLQCARYTLQAGGKSLSIMNETHITPGISNVWAGL